MGSQNSIINLLVYVNFETFLWIPVLRHRYTGESSTSGRSPPFRVLSSLQGKCRQESYFTPKALRNTIDSSSQSTKYSFQAPISSSGDTFITLLITICDSVSPSEMVNTLFSALILTNRLFHISDASCLLLPDRYRPYHVSVGLCLITQVWASVARDACTKIEGRKFSRPVRVRTCNVIIV